MVIVVPCCVWQKWVRVETVGPFVNQGKEDWEDVLGHEGGVEGGSRDGVEGTPLTFSLVNKIMKSNIFLTALSFFPSILLLPSFTSTPDPRVFPYPRGNSCKSLLCTLIHRMATQQQNAPAYGFLQRLAPSSVSEHRTIHTLKARRCNLHVTILQWKSKLLVNKKACHTGLENSMYFNQDVSLCLICVRWLGLGPDPICCRKPAAEKMGGARQRRASS
jgi:hypothetical protein